MEITLTDNIKEATRYLDTIQRQQIPFATSRALNDTAKDAQSSVIKAIPKIFQNKKKWWLKQQPTGIKVDFSNKLQLTARVYTNAYFAELQEKGGTKRPKSGRNIAVPTDKVPRKYRKSDGAKKMMAERKNVFSTPKGIFRRTGKKKLTLLWSYTPQARIRRRFGFVEIVRKVVKRRFLQHFEKRLAQALATARKPRPPR